VLSREIGSRWKYVVSGDLIVTVRKKGQEKMAVEESFQEKQLGFTWQVAILKKKWVLAPDRHRSHPIHWLKLGRKTIIAYQSDFQTCYFVIDCGHMF
jgi:hypothetical protein